MQFADLFRDVQSTCPPATYLFVLCRCTWPRKYGVIPIGYQTSSSVRCTPYSTEILYTLYSVEWQKKARTRRLDTSWQQRPRGWGQKPAAPRWGSCGFNGFSKPSCRRLATQLSATLWRILPPTSSSRAASGESAIVHAAALLRLHTIP